MDGVNLEYYGDWGAVTSRFNIIVGATTTSSGDLDVSSEDHWVLSWNMNWEWLTFQASYSESLVTVAPINTQATNANELIGSTLTGAQLESITMDSNKGHFAGVGVAADFGSWFAGAEYTDVGVDDSPLNPDKKSWYVTGGFRSGALTMSLTYANTENPNNEDTVETLSTALIPGLEFVRDDPFGLIDNDAASAGASQILDVTESTYIIGFDAESINLTIRYDFHPSAAFKFDYTQEEADYEDVNGNITTREPSLVRMGVDLVF
ncbi:MAG: porin [Pseudomonadales bacterium]|nr:porin [Pseudomonadales bacterium]